MCYSGLSNILVQCQADDIFGDNETTYIRYLDNKLSTGIAYRKPQCSHFHYINIFLLLTAVMFYPVIFGTTFVLQLEASQQHYYSINHHDMNLWRIHIWAYLNAKESEVWWLASPDLQFFMDIYMLGFGCRWLPKSLPLLWPTQYKCRTAVSLKT